MILDKPEIQQGGRKSLCLDSRNKWFVKHGKYAMIPELFGS